MNTIIPQNHRQTRRRFLINTTNAAIAALFAPRLVRADKQAGELIKPCGPASTCRPKLTAAFVRRRGEYGMRWPGQIYDGKAAYEKYKQGITDAAKALNMDLDMRSGPIYSPEEADAWIAGTKHSKPDGLMVVALDRQEHTWPTINKAIDTGLPTVVYSPLGTSFTTNTAAPSKKHNVFISSTDDFSQAVYGIKMLHAGAKLRATRFLVLKGTERRQEKVGHFGTDLHYIPAVDFITEYNRLGEPDLVKKLARELKENAVHMHGPTDRDVLNGIKSYLVAENLLEREKCDAITMDCLGALSGQKTGLPCIAWSKMNDHGIPAACEADIGACITHALVQYLFDRPGFQQDPVAETSRDCLIGSHCSCPTKLNGFKNPAEPYEIVRHHGDRDATAKPIWKVGQRITVADVILHGGDKPQMIISAGTVVENKSIPPSGGCVVAPMVELDQVTELLDYPGFHQLFFYGDYKKQLKAYCGLWDIEAVVV